MGDRDDWVGGHHGDSGGRLTRGPVGGSHLAHGVVGPERSVGDSGRDSRGTMGTDAILSGSQHRHFRASLDRLIVVATAHNNTRNGGCHSSGNGGVSALGVTTGNATATTVTEMVQSSKARGCSTDRSGTTAALLASCGACGVRDGSTTRPLSVRPKGGCGERDTQGRWAVRRISESRENTEKCGLDQNARTLAPRPATSARKHSRVMQAFRKR